MKHLFSFLSIIILIRFVGNAQSTFQQVYDGYDHGIQISNVFETSDHGFILSGTIALFELFGFGPGDIFLMRTDADGNVLWRRQWDLMNDEQVFGMYPADDGSYLICGFTFGATTSSRDGFILKADDDGNLLWVQRIDHNGGSNTFHSIMPVDPSHVILSGRSEGGTGGQYDMYLALADTAGTIQWGRTYGGSQWDWGWWAEQTNDGGFIMTGESQSFGIGSNDIYLVKTDGNGMKQWSKAYGSTEFEKGLWVTQRGEDYYVAGYTQGFVTGDLEAKTFLMKTDLNGAVQWFRIYKEMDTPGSVESTPDGGFLLIGGYYNTSLSAYDMNVIKTDSSGNVEWARTYGTTSSESGKSIAQLSNGYAFAGISYYQGSSVHKAYLVRTDHEGNVPCYDDSYTVTIYNATPITVTPSDSVSSGFTSYIPVSTQFIPSVDTFILCDSAIITSASESFSNLSLTVYPTPAHNYIVIDGLLQQPTIILFTDLAGRVMKTEKRSVIDVSDLAPGTYFVTCQNKNQAETRKILIE